MSASFLPGSSETIGRYRASVLLCNPNLTELDLSENPLGDTRNCKVKKQDLNTCYLTNASCVDLSSFLQVSQTLKELFHLCEGLWHANGIIKNLVLSECFLSPASCESVTQVLNSTRSLTRLLLINNKIEDLGLKLLCEGLKQPDCQLKDLVLWTCHLTGECCQDSCNALYTNEHLRVLELMLAECHFTDACCGALYLSGNHLKDFGVQMLCDALLHPICELQTFYHCTEKRELRTDHNWNT
ncbi:hypothetical protein FD755_025297 [Muntiacus reevesi]|uniref:Uncharacterized protein n=1 Tax=Muntiacus reevesi TaxID=9886 RepID=A0A5N3UNJ8_MUNRE|nr:hypothetical protein FD755_025297 [Muntiacus reevesi]